MKTMNHVELSNYAGKIVEILVEKGCSIVHYEVKCTIKDDKFENYVDICANDSKYNYWCKYDMYFDEYDEDYDLKCRIHKYPVIKDDNYNEISRCCNNMDELLEGLKNFENYEILLQNIKDTVNAFDNDDENCLENDTRLSTLGLKLSNGEEYFFQGDNYDNLMDEYLKSCVYLIVDFEDYVKYSCQNW